MVTNFVCTSPEQTTQHAALFSDYLSSPLRIYLSGDLGAGKTHWVRALLQARGELHPILSPSYALIYSYQTTGILWHHIDCYRLQGSAIGDDLLELLEDDAICLLEWPSFAKYLPPPDLTIDIDFTIEDQRQLMVCAKSIKMELMLEKTSHIWSTWGRKVF